MAALTPTQRAWRGRIEAGLRLAAPVLDLVLAAGDRLSRAVDRDTELDAGPVPTPVGTHVAARQVGNGNGDGESRA